MLKIRFQFSCHCHSFFQFLYCFKNKRLLAYELFCRASCRFLETKRTIRLCSLLFSLLLFKLCRWCTAAAAAKFSKILLIGWKEVELCIGSSSSSYVVIYFGIFLNCAKQLVYFQESYCCMCNLAQPISSSFALDEPSLGRIRRACQITLSLVCFFHLNNPIIHVGGRKQAYNFKALA